MEAMGGKIAAKEIAERIGVSTVPWAKLDLAKMSDEELKKKEEELRVQLAPAVEREVKIYLILEEIGKLENIKPADANESLPGKVMEFLLKEAAWKDVK